MSSLLKLVRVLALAPSVAAYFLVSSSNGHPVVGHVNPSVPRDSLPAVVSCKQVYHVNAPLGESCEQISAATGLSEDDLLAVNADLNCSTAVPFNAYLCIDAASADTPLVSVQCQLSYALHTNESCQAIRSAFDLSAATFLLINSGQDCTALPTVCLQATVASTVLGGPSVSTFIAQDVVHTSYCNAFVQVTSPTACMDISMSSPVSITQLNMWNTGLNCWGLKQNDTLCIGVGELSPASSPFIFSSSTMTTSATSTTGSSTTTMSTIATSAATATVLSTTTPSFSSLTSDTTTSSTTFVKTKNTVIDSSTVWSATSATTTEPVTSAVGSIEASSWWSPSTSGVPVPQLIANIQVTTTVWVSQKTTTSYVWAPQISSNIPPSSPSPSPIPIQTPSAVSANANTNGGSGSGSSGTGNVLISGSGQGSYYYDIEGKTCNNDPAYPENTAYTSCEPNAGFQTLQQRGNNNIVALALDEMNANKAGLCGKRVVVKVGGVVVQREFVVWDSCAACSGGVRLDFSVSGLQAVSGDACTLGLVPNVSWEVMDEQVIPYVP
ncbi:hypothetical protein BC830DRAFT_1150064 [Chytriomyces sp. MP71]|nr:hypothetical protein BC830DRAFT_1150064 [Chytriomyces sp. MP71]